MPTYFEARRVNKNEQRKAELPDYIINELPIDKNAKILEIGCGYGFMLQEFKERSYKNSSGIDIDASAVKHCTDNSLNASLITDLKKYLQASKDKYDFVIMSHIIEHLKKDDIIPTLSAIYENILNESGKLVILTPNAQALVGAYWLHEDFTHELIFTSGSLYYVLYMSGFRNIKFLDIYSTANLGFIKKFIRYAALKTYEIFITALHKLLANAYYDKSEKIFSVELKAVAVKEI